jgi:ADP-heptose:LPS heptosyltransferase
MNRRGEDIELLSGILSRHDIDFHMLQIVVREADRAALESLPQLRNHIAALAEMADTAALMSLLDLVITVDTAAAHLGGALGLPTWVMLPWAADWRWMLDRTDTPWYPTMRLFRQARRGDWGGVLADVAQALDRWSL